ncbi:unnamed protein product [Anisakis simplex]|uniref:Uncharacterized protein n=1 Tax=Anisakis simplex TaxID=6269 RepID=A0A0M3J3A9_ANISI|nr:unnamed protein product [Anisakis simplex]
MLRIVISCYRYLQEKQFLKMQSSSSRETPLGSGDADVTSLNGGVPADKNGDPLAAIHGNDLHSVAISNIDIREFTNPAETDC